MKLYQDLDVDLTYQNFGSAWLGILRGATHNIELAFNGLFNLCATNGERKYQDHAKCVAIFWSNRRAMRRFFFNRYYLSRYIDRHDVNNGKLVRKAMRDSLSQLDLLKETSHESFLNFLHDSVPDIYISGRISAERPDYDMKDAILASAFVDKDFSTNKTVDAN